jgi:hypothetical protein
MTKLDRDLSQEVKRHQNEKRQIKYVITQLINQKQELEEKFTKITPLTKPSALSTKPPALLKLNTTKLSALSFSTLKKPNTASPKTNIKYTPVNYLKEALTLKSLSYIKFNKIQIEKIEIETFNTPTPKQRNNIQKEIIEIANLELNTSSPRPNEIQITFLTLEHLLQTVFIASKPLPHASPADSLLIKRKCLRLSKHKLKTDNTSAFTFDKPSSTNPLEYINIDKPKDVIKKNKP